MTALETWPDGKQAAVTVTVNLDAESLDLAQAGALPLWGRMSHGRYGAQAGAYNLIELFKRYDLKATFFIGAWDAERYPDLMEAIAAAGHEVAGHGYCHEDFSKLSVEQQEEILDKSEGIFQSIFGQKPVGFRAPDRLMSKDTRDLLIKRGYLYDSGYADDDRPYVATGSNGEGQIVELPCHDPWSDRMFYERHRPPYVVADALADEFIGTYAIGGLYNLMIHPRGDVGSGRASRVRALDQVLKTIHMYPHVLIGTCRDIAQLTLDNIATS